MAAAPATSSATSRRASSIPSSASSQFAYEAWLHRAAGRPGGRDHGPQHQRSSIRQVALTNFADWTDRIAEGELPKSKPQRPQGVERNVVVTMWDWGDADDYLHDEIATDRRNPDRQCQRQDLRRDRGFDRSRAGARSGDPHRRSQVKLDHPHAGEAARHVHLAAGGLPEPAVALLGRGAALGQRRPTPHNPMFDHKGRVWLTSRIREAADAGVLPQGLRPSVGEAVPDRAGGPAGRRSTIRRPASSRMIDTCFTTHHLNLRRG